MISGSSNAGTQASPQLPLFPSETAAMNLYRAIYQPTDGGTRIRSMTFAAPDAEHATRVAEDWELRSDRLLAVKPISSRRPVLPYLPGFPH